MDWSGGGRGRKKRQTLELMSLLEQETTESIMSTNSEWYKRITVSVSHLMTPSNRNKSKKNNMKITQMNTKEIKYAETLKKKKNETQDRLDLQHVNRTLTLLPLEDSVKELEKLPVNGKRTFPVSVPRLTTHRTKQKREKQHESSAKNTRDQEDRTSQRKKKDDETRDII